LFAKLELSVETLLETIGIDGSRLLIRSPFKLSTSPSAVFKRRPAADVKSELAPSRYMKIDRDNPDAACVTDLKFSVSLAMRHSQ
jgi:hypothetical protein